MATISEDLKCFTNFVEERLRTNATEQSLSELFDQWLIENPNEEEYAENVAAVQASIEDFKRGERGRPAGQISQELRREYTITDE